MNRRALWWLPSLVAAVGLGLGCSDGSAGGGTGGNGGDGGTAATGGSGGTAGSTQLLDRSNVSFVDNLLAKEADGEWTRGEGLVATLKLFAGEAEKEDVLRHTELLEYEGTGIVAMAYEYLEAGPDAGASAEINRLLDLLVFSDARLEAMAGITPKALSTPSHPPSIDRKDAISDCNEFFAGYELPLGLGNCLQVRSALEDDYPGAFRIFAPAPPLPTAGWTEQHYDGALQALNDTVPVFKQLGYLRAASLVFSVRDHPIAAAVAAPKMLPSDCDPSAPGPYEERCEPSCGIALYLYLRSSEPEEFKQYIAHELAHCFQQETFRKQNQVKYEVRKWREESLAEYLSEVAYIYTNLEWRFLDELAEVELYTTLFDRSYENVVFFQYLASVAGVQGVLDLVSRLPESGERGAQEKALASYEGIDELYHDFAKALTDHRVLDASSVALPYPISTANLNTTPVTDRAAIIEDFYQPFGVSRNLLTANDGKEAVLSFTPKGKTKASARALGESAEWDDVPATVPHECSEVILLATSTQANTGFELSVPEVRDAGVCTIDGTWVVDNDSLGVKQTTFELEYVSGEIVLTLDQGTAQVIYDNFEFKVFKDVTFSMLGIEHHRHEEFTYTTNAQGATTYEINGDEIEFSDFSEGNYIEGTVEVHQVRTTVPMSGFDIDDTSTREFTFPGERSLFEWIRTYELQSNGAIMQLRSGDNLIATLKRVSDAP